MDNEIVNVPSVSSEIVKESEKKAGSYLVNARTTLIRNDEDYTIAGATWNDGRRYLQLIDTERKKGTEPLNKVIKQINAWFKPISDQVQSGMDIIAKQMSIYDANKKKVAEELNRKALAEAEKKAKELEERAKKAEESGKSAKAEELRMKAEMQKAVAPVVQSETQKVAGTRMAKEFSYTVNDKKLIPLEYLEINDAMVKKVAKATDGAIVIPGLTITYTEKMVGSR
jgi:hypothetical protein